MKDISEVAEKFNFNPNSEKFDPEAWNIIKSLSDQLSMTHMRYLSMGHYLAIGVDLRKRTRQKYFCVILGGSNEWDVKYNYIAYKKTQGDLNLKDLAKKIQYMIMTH